MADTTCAVVPVRRSPSNPVAGGLAAAGITVLLWGAAFPAIHIALGQMQPAPLAALRFAIAGVALGAALLVRRRPLPRGVDLLLFALCGAVGILGYNLLLNSGQETVSAGAASFIVNIQPVLAAIIAGLALKERLRPLAWLGMAVSLGGVALIAAGQPGGLAFGRGAVLVLGAAFCSASYFVLQKPLAARYGPLTAASLTILFGALWLSPSLPEGIAEAARMDPSGWAAMLFLALGAGVAGYLFWMRALAALGAARATLLLYGVAPLALAISAALTGERPSAPVLIGGLLCLAGVAVSNLRPPGLGRSLRGAGRSCS
jgi:drug/metabolite transporter (DMT)-like permease